MTYFVRRFKPKLLVFITTGMFNLLSKILESDPPERDPFGSRPKTEVSSVLELVRRLSSAFAFDRR